MISLTQFKAHIFEIFRLMVKAPLVMDVVYKGKVYELHIKETDKNPIIKRTKAQKTTRLLAVDTKVCPECGGLTFNEICMNPRCVSNE